MHIVVTVIFFFTLSHLRRELDILLLCSLPGGEPIGSWDGIWLFAYITSQTWDLLFFV